MKQNKVYVFPHLGRNDLGVLRFGGYGLANLMFCWANAAAFANKHDFQMIWPTWGQVKRLTILGGYGDRRLYIGQFKKPKNYVSSLQGIWKRLFVHSITADPNSNLEEVARDAKVFVQDRKKSILIVFSPSWTQKVCFSTLFEHKDFLKSQLKEMRPTAFGRGEGETGKIAIHVRLGDLPFDGAAVLNGARVRSHARLPIKYYRLALEYVRNFDTNEFNACVFSDGTDEELVDLVSEQGVNRVTLATAFDEMIAMSESRYLIGSGSTFSKWASFLSEGVAFWPMLTPRFVTKADGRYEKEFNPSAAE